MYKNRLSQLDDENLKVGASFYLPKQKVDKNIKSPKEKKPPKQQNRKLSNVSSSSESSSSSSSSESESDEDSSSDEEDNKNNNLSASTNRLSASKKKSALSLFSVPEKTSKSKTVGTSGGGGTGGGGGGGGGFDSGFDDIAATFVDEDDDDDFSDVDDDEKKDKMGTGGAGGDAESSFDKSFSKKEAEVLQKTKSSESGKVMTSSPSFVKSMNEYMVRRKLVEEKVNEGHVQAEHVDGKVHVTKQGDLEMYSEENQIMRSKIKRSPQFQTEVKRLWELVSFDDKLTKSQYIKMITKICRLIIPPPIDKEDILQTAMDDWEQDLKWAQDHQLVSNDSNELNYDSFFKSIFELVDTWTASALEKEYIELTHRLIDGIAQDFQGHLRWKQDEIIVFDSYFSFRKEQEVPKQENVEEETMHALEENDEGDEEEEEVVKKDVFDELIAEQEEGPSILEPMGIDDKAKKKKKKKRKKNDKEPPLLPASKVYARIAQIYQLKQQADLWATTSNKAKPIRFDKFVLRCFMQEFGTRKIARRHLRHFVVSAQRHLMTHGEKVHPRIYLFCVLSGIITIPPTDEFNPRYSAEYFQPALRFLFTNPRAITEILGDGTGDGCLLLKQAIEKAVIPLNLKQVLGGPFAVRSFKSKMKELTLETAKGHMVNFDKATYLALDLWRFSDTLRTLRERSALKTVQKFLRAKCLRKQMEKEESKWLEEDEEEGNDRGVEIITTTSADVINSEGGGGGGGRVSEKDMTLPSPRTVDKISQAKELDQKLNTSEKSLNKNDSLRKSIDTTKTNNNTNANNVNRLGQHPSYFSSSSIDSTYKPADGEPRCDPKVQELLLSLGLGKFIKKFAAEEIDMTALKMMSEFDMAEINISKGARVKIRNKVASMSS
jgi:hypothetical protein